jgi:hypothetical protein
MKPIFTLVFALVLPFAATAQGTDTAMAQGTVASDAAPQAESPLAEMPARLPMLDARDIDVREYIWTSRILVVMADTPDDPSFARQLAALREREDEFVLRDVVVVFDAHPDDVSPLRAVLRPRGFMTAIIDKDGEVKARRPAYRTGREWMAMIDRFPTRRQELLEQLPAGR